MRNLVARLSGSPLDAALAAAVSVILLAGELLTADITGEPLGVPSLAVLLAGAASLSVLSRWPLVTGVALGTATPLYYMLGSVDGWSGWGAFAVGVFRLAAERHRLSAVVGTTVAFGFFLAGEMVHFELGRSLMALAWLIVVLAAGEIARSRRAYLHEYEQRAVEAERSREETARRRATEERLRIARELHDVIAHNISLINVQAGAAAHRRDPEQAYETLASIGQASKETLRELRSTLGVLRRVDEKDAAPVAPVPSLARLDDLAAQVTRAGLPVSVDTEGDHAPLPSAVDLAAYRIIQEALTNAVRHAGATGAMVSLRYTCGTVAVQIDDDGDGVPGTAVSAGEGLRGMRERATSVGGDVTAEPRPEGGFRVRAVLPLSGGTTGM
ncbi:sensor histidine kinase [Allosalinactinospora lopnorensis]|uniref:sensor histidine kinase n=1 Tax=Allosalinactinospora lopnorensis TaxID=1352348 RepID=UPI0006988108|nr:sensor histidine kinase [Allosalinactinospora lopnorensis]